MLKQSDLIDLNATAIKIFINNISCGCVEHAFAAHDNAEDRDFGGIELYVSKDPTHAINYSHVRDTIELRGARVYKFQMIIKSVALADRGYCIFGSIDGKVEFK